MAAERDAELVRLARDLDALTGAGLLLEVTARDPEFVAVMLRLVVRHAQFAEQRARLLLATEEPPRLPFGLGFGGGGS